MKNLTKKIIGGTMKVDHLPLFDIFLLYYLLLLVLIVGGIRIQRIKQNEWSGLRTPATLSDPEIWEKANKVTGIIMIILGIFLLFFNTISYYLKYPVWIQIILMLTLPMGLGIFGIIYSDNLKIEKEKSQLKPFTISKNFLYAMTLISVSAIVVGIFLTRLRRISGFGFIIAGAIFTFLFYKDSHIDDEEKRTSNFSKHYLWFALATVICSIFSIVL